MSVSKDHIKIRQNFAQMIKEKATSFAVNMTRDIMHIPHDLTGKPVVNGDVKEADRILEKANGRYNGHLDEITDIGRLSILFNDPDQFLAVRNLFQSEQKMKYFAKELEKSGIKIKEFEDNYAKPKDHGFIGANLIISITFKKGRTEDFEIQFKHRDMVEVDKQTHKTYKAQRSIEERAKAENRDLNDKDKKLVLGYQISNAHLYKTCAQHHGLDNLLDDPNAFDNIINKMQAKLQELQADDNVPAYQDTYVPEID